MKVQLTNREGFTVKAKVDQSGLVKLKLKDKFGCKYTNVSLIIKHKNIFHLILNNSQVPFALKDFQNSFNSDPNSFFVQKRNRFFVIFDKYGLQAGGKKTAMAAGLGTAVASVLAVVTAPFWVPPVAAFVGASAAVVGTAVGIASTTAVTSGAQVASYGYNTPAERFENWQCAKEAFKGATQGAVGGAFIAAGAATGGTLAPILIYSAGGAASEVTHEWLEEREIDKEKVMVAALSGAAGGVITKAGAFFKVSTDHTTWNAVKGGAVGLTSGAVSASITEYADSENLSVKEKVSNVALNAGVGMVIGGLSGAAQAKAAQRAKQKLNLKPTPISSKTAGQGTSSAPVEAMQNEVPPKSISILSKNEEIHLLEQKINSLEQQRTGQTQTLLENKQRLRALLITEYKAYMIDKYKGELGRIGRDVSFDTIFEKVHNGKGVEVIEGLFQANPAKNPVQIANRNLDVTQNLLVKHKEFHSLLNLSELTTKHAPSSSSVFKEALKPESIPIKGNCSLKEMVPHIVLVHAILPDSIWNGEGELTKELDVNKIEDKNYMASFTIQKILTSDGRIGRHLQFNNGEFTRGLEDRPHIHWCWNQLVPPNRKNSWEEARIAVLEPLSTFEDSTDHKPYGVAPYDTLIFGEHCLSERSIVLVPKPILKIVRSHLCAYKGKVIGYDPAKTLRVAIFEKLNKKYPNTWHVCTEKGQPLGPYQQSPTETGCRAKTFIRKEDGTVLHLLQGESRAKSQSMKEYLASKRFIGLHHNSTTIWVEDRPYFKLLKKFTKQHDTVVNRSYFGNQEYYRFAGHVDSAEDVERLVVLKAFNLAQSLNEYDPATNAQNFAKYIMRETMHADLVSCCSPSDAPLSFLDARLILNIHYDSLMRSLDNLSECLKSEERKEEAFTHFASYHKCLEDAVGVIFTAKNEVKKELDNLQERSTTDEIPFWKFAAEEWEKVSIPENTEFSFTKNLPLEEELYKYIIKLIEHFPDDLEKLKILYMQVLACDQDNLTNDKKYQLNVILCVINFLLQQKKFFQLQGFDSKILTNQTIFSDNNPSIDASSSELEGFVQQDSRLPDAAYGQASFTGQTNEENASKINDKEKDKLDIMPIPSSSISVSQEPWHEKVKSLLNGGASATEIINAFCENYRVKAYYAKAAGVVEGYTVGKHTEMVLRLAQEYRGYLEPQISEYLLWGDFLLFLALHDIGKGESKEIASYSDSAAAKQLELEANQRILTLICEQLWVPSKIGNIFQALLMYDAQGDYLRGTIDAETIKGYLLTMAAATGLSPEGIYKIYTNFHLVDAASYPSLYSLFIFEEASLRHCEGYQLMIDALHQTLPKTL